MNRRRKHFENVHLNAGITEKEFIRLLKWEITPFSFSGWASEITWPIQYEQQVVNRNTVSHGHTSAVYRLSSERNLGKEDLCCAVYCNYIIGHGLAHVLFWICTKNCNRWLSVSTKKFSKSHVHTYPPVLIRQWYHVEWHSFSVVNFKQRPEITLEVPGWRGRSAAVLCKGGWCIGRAKRRLLSPELRAVARDLKWG